MAIPTAPADALIAWTAAHPAYTYTVDATELGTSGTYESVTLHIGFDGHSETVHVVRGKSAGTDIIWRGGTSVTVRPRGLFHVVSLAMGIRDTRVLSPRKNDIRVGILAGVASCFARFAKSIVIERSDASGRVFAIHNAAGVHCGDADGDDKITVDRLTVAADGHPIARERSIGSQLVVRWLLHDISTGT